MKDGRNDQVAVITNISRNQIIPIVMKILTAFLTALALSVSPCISAELEKDSEDIPLKFVEAAAAYNLLTDAFPDIRKTVTAIRIDANALTVRSNSPELDEIRKAIAEIDARPKQMLIQASIIEIDPDGNEECLSRPLVIVTEGEPGIYSFDRKDGRKMKIVLRAASVKK